MKHVELIQKDLKELQDMVQIHPMLEPYRYEILTGNKEKLANIILAQQESLSRAGREAVREIENESK